MFQLESLSLNDADSMGMPPGTVVDAQECEDDASTIVWLGKGNYPGETAGDARRDGRRRVDPRGAGLEGPPTATDLRRM